MQTTFVQTREEELKEIEMTIMEALKLYDQAKRNDDDKLVQECSSIINAELERLKDLKFTNENVDSKSTKH